MRRLAIFAIVFFLALSSAPFSGPPKSILAQSTVEAYAESDIPVDGTVTGSYLDTELSDDAYESIKESVDTKGKPSRRRSYLEHKWTVDVPAGRKTQLTFNVEAYHTPNSEGDDFVFAYSLDDSSYQDMLTVVKTSDDDTPQSYGLPTDLSGTVYIRVRDANRSGRRIVQDTVYIDQMSVLAELAPAGYDVTVLIDEDSQSVELGGSTTYSVIVKNTGDYDADFNVVLTGTAVSDPTISVVPDSWTVLGLAEGTEEQTLVTVSTASEGAAGTYDLVAEAVCVQDGSVSSSNSADLLVSHPSVKIGGGDLGYCGGSLVQTTVGSKYAIFFNRCPGQNLRIYRVVDSTPVKVADETYEQVVGKQYYMRYVSAGIDGNDDIHVAVASGGKSTRDVAYRFFDTATDSWEGVWEEAAPYSGQNDDEGVQLVVDSDGYPRALYQDIRKVSGTKYDQIYYTDKTSGSWSTPERVNISDTLRYSVEGGLAMSMCPQNDVEAFYFKDTWGEYNDPVFNRRDGSWGTEDSYAESSSKVWDVVCTTEDDVYRYHTAGSAYNIEENDVDTGYDAWANPYEHIVSASLVGSDRYLFFIDTNRDVHLVSCSGSACVDDGVLQVGLNEGVLSEWAYNFENQSGEINYLFQENYTIYWASYSLAP